MKRGTLGATISIIIMIVAVIFVASGIASKILKAVYVFLGVEEDDSVPPLSAGKSDFDSFAGYYERCKHQSSGDCYCDQFDVKSLPEGMTISIQNLLSQKKTRIEMFEAKPTPEKVKVIDNDGICIYRYEKATDSYSKINIDRILLKNDGVDKSFEFNKNIMLFKADGSNTCFAEKTSDREGFTGITRRFTKCELKAKGINDAKLALLDLGLSDTIGGFDGEQKSAAVLEGLERRLADIGRVSRITKEFASVSIISKRRTAWFNSLYSREGGEEKSLKNKVLIISVGSFYKNKDDSGIKQDYFTIHYYKGSLKSRQLAESIKLSLDSAYGKLYKGGEEFNIAEIGEEYRFNAISRFEENDNANKGPLFLMYTEGDYNINEPPWKYSWSEKGEIPAVFIDIVEVNGDGHYMFEGHNELISEKIFEGANKYLNGEKGVVA